MEYLKQHKFAVGFVSVAVVAAVAGALLYWFWWRPKHGMKQEMIGEPVVPMPRIPLPQGTRPVQGPVKRLPKATPSTHYPTQGQSKHMSAADAIRQAGSNQPSDEGDDADLDGFFETGGIEKGTEYPTPRR